MDVMLDVESWGLRPGSAIRSVGLVAFKLGDPSVEQRTLYANVDRESCRERGLREEAETVEWWSRQDSAAQLALEADPLPLLDAVVLVEKFWNMYGCKYVWAQGANFDPVLWESACRAVGREAPWRFFCVRDTRTVYDLAGLNARSIPRAGGVAHNALDDATHQVMCLRWAWAMLHDVEEVKKRRARLLGLPADEQI
jgi:hypothetical protein